MVTSGFFWCDLIKHRIKLCFIHNTQPSKLHVQYKFMQNPWLYLDCQIRYGRPEAYPACPTKDNSSSFSISVQLRAEIRLCKIEVLPWSLRFRVEEWKTTKYSEIKIIPHWSCTPWNPEMNYSPETLVLGSRFNRILQSASNWLIINFLLYS